MSEWFPVSAGARQGCAVAPDMFLEPIDWMAGRTSHRGFLGITVSLEVFWLCGRRLQHGGDASWSYHLRLGDHARSIFPAGTRNQLEQDQDTRPWITSGCSVSGPSPWSSSGAGRLVYIPRIMYWIRWWEWYGYSQTNRTSPHIHEGTGPWNLAHVYLIVNQASFVQGICILPVLLYGTELTHGVWL